MTGEVERQQEAIQLPMRAPLAARQLFFAVLTLAVLSALFAPLSINRTEPNPPVIHAGRVSFAAHPLAAYPVMLAGEWKLTWRSPSLPRGPKAGDTALVTTPGPWTGVITNAGARLPVSGLATYSLELSGLTPNRTHYLHVQTICPASRVRIDGRVVSSAGIVGSTAATTRPSWISQDVSITPHTDTVQLEMDVAAFNHKCNGILAPPVLGLQAATQKWVKIDIGQDFLFHGTLLLLTVFAIVIFVFRPTDRASLYFGLSLMLFMPASVLLGRENLILLVFPHIDFNLMLEIIYLAGIGAMAFFLGYANALFPRESPRSVFLAIQATFAIAFILTLWIFVQGNTFLASVLYSDIAYVFVVVLIYIVVVVGLAMIRGREGAAILFFGVIALVATVSIGVLSATNDVRDTGSDINAASVGLLAMLFSQVIILAQRWASAIRNAETLAGDMRRLIDLSSSITSEIRLETLLAKIVAATSKFLSAERSSLFLFDPKKNRLWSLVAEGLNNREIQLAPDEGVAGDSFSNGSVVNVQDAYGDSRFNREVDESTGYRTRNILAMPVAARDGRKLGVLQALNRTDATGFDAGDVERMTAFAAQAAIAIDNATLFSEVVEARNYNESILRSMSSGVVTIDNDGSIVKLNEAACAIMEFSAQQVIGRQISTLLLGENAWFVPEIEGVRADGRSRTFLDVVFRTGAGRNIDMNIQIVPLFNNGATTGLLVIVEDIRQEKRLEGAMRRFMTPKVVDQVLQNQDDILFGTSCTASVLFADIRNFTTMAEHLSPRATVDMLNEIFTGLVEAVSANDGVLDKFMGDAVMAVFGAPLPSGRDAAHAVASANAMMCVIVALNVRRAERNELPLRLGIGIATGDVVAGTIGSPKRMDYTVIGDSVNLASRLQNASKTYAAGIVVCEATANALLDVKSPDAELVRELDTIRVRGRARTERIFQVLSYHTEATFPNMHEVLRIYAEGMKCSRAGDWQGAIAAFEAALRHCPSDGPSARQLERARSLAANPPAQDWDGVWAGLEMA